MESRYRAERRSNSSLTVRLRALVAFVVSVLLAVVGVATAPAAHAEAGAVSISKTIDDKKTAYDKGDTVTYRLAIQCSSLEVPCVTAVLTDVLDSNLTYSSFTVGRKKDDEGVTSAVPVTLSQSGQTLTFNIGVAGTDESKWFMDGESFDIVVSAKVKSVPDNAGRTIDNTATLQPAGGTLKTSETATITVNPAAPSVYDWGLTKYKTSPSGNPVVGGNVSYDIRFTRPYNSSTGKPVAGGVDLSSFTLTDAIPAGATYVSSYVDGASGTPLYNSGANTITFPSTTLAADQLYCNDPCITGYVANITVNYPSGTFHADDEPVNKVTAVVQYADGHADDTLTAQAKVTLKDEVKELSGYKQATNWVNPTPGEKVGWDLTTLNVGNVPLSEVTITDQLPAHLDNVQVGASGWYMPMDRGPGDFEYTMDGTTWLSLGTLTNQTSNRLDVPAGATGVRSTVKNLGVDKYAGFQVYAEVADDAPIGLALNNCMKYPFSASGGDATACANLSVEDKPQASVYVSKSRVGADGSDMAARKVVPGDEFQWILDWRILASTVPTTVTLTDLLPSQFELVTEQAPCLEYDVGWYSATGDDCAAGSTTPAYTTEDVAGGTKITFTNLALPTLPNQGDYKYRVRLHVRVKDGAAAGTYTNKMTLALPANFEMSCNWGAAECAATNDVAIDSAAAVGLQKWDKGTEPNVAQDTGKASAKCPDWNGFTRYPCVAQTLPGGDLTYRLKWSNQGNVPLADAIVYDILPYVGDTGVSQTLADSTRKTEWVPVLTGPITLDDSLSTAADSGYVVEYNLTTNPCRPEVKEGSADGVWQSGCDNTWVTSVADWSTVKSFRIKAYQADGAQWPAGKRLVFTIPMRAPADAAKSTISPSVDLSVAWNSAAQRAFQVKADGSEVRLQASEPRKVGIIIPAPYVSIGDYVWYDANYNGKQDENEEPVKGLKVTLKDAGGTTIASTTTDDDGYYWFQNLSEKTDYILEFDKPSGYDWTTRNASGDTVDAIDSDVNPATSRISFTSPTWVSGESHNLGGHDLADDPTLDAGLVLPHELVSVGDYVWYDANRDGLQSAGEQPIKGVTVKLIRDGAVVDTTTTNDEGYYWFTGLLAGEPYTVEFVKPTGAEFTTANAGGITSNSPTGDLNDSDAPATGVDAGKVTFVAEASGENSGGANQADNPGIDAGFLAYDLTLKKRLETTGTVYPRGTVTYTLTPENLGPVDALGGWSVTDLLPDGLTLQSISSASPNYTCTVVDAHTGTCTNSVVLPDGETAPVITVVAKVDDNASGSLKNVAYVDKAATDVAELIPLIVPGLDTDTSSPDTNNDSEAVVELTVPLVSVGDFVWYDTNRDGLQTAGESPVVGAGVNLYKRGETTPWKTTTTNTSGYYWFQDLISLNDYTIEFVKPAGTTFTGQNSGGVVDNLPSDTGDSDADPGTGRVDFTAELLGDNEGAANVADNPGIDAGLIKYNLVLDKTLTTTGSIRLGQDVTYTLVPSNEGPVDSLAGWSVTDLLPTGLTLKSITGAEGAGYTCTVDSASKGSCTNSTVLPAGHSAGVITVVATVGANLSGSLKNVAYVAPNASDTVETNPLGGTPTVDTDTSTSPTDNDDEAVIDLKPLVSIGDYVWYDNDRDGQQDDTEAPYAGMTVELWNADGSAKLATTQTTAAGYYAFRDLEAATDYQVKFVKAADESFTARLQGDVATDSNPVLATGVATVKTPATGSNLTDPGKADDPTIDAGIVKYNLVIAKSMVSTGPFYERGKATFEIVPSNQGPADELAGWSVTDLLPVGLTVDTVAGEGYSCVVTASSDGFTCTAAAGLAAGASGNKITVVTTIGNNVVGTLHNVTFVSPSPDGSVPETNLLVAPTRGVTDTSATATDNDAQADLEVRSLVSVGDYVWWDTNRDGVQTEGEEPVSGVTVNLLDADGVFVKSTVTDGVGFYSFDDLVPGAGYTVEFVKPVNTVFTWQNADGVADTADSDADRSNGKVAITAPASGENSLTSPDDPTIDAGLIKLVSIGDYVWWDNDRDGQQGDDELPVSGVTVNLLDSSGNLLGTTTTDGDGFYSFTDLLAGATYQVVFVKPDHTVFTGSNAGDDASDSDPNPLGAVLVVAPSDGANSAETPDDPTIDAGLVKLVSIGDYVWWDNNRDGKQTLGEPVVPGVTVNLYDADGQFVGTTTTNGVGFYSFADLFAETDYTVEFVKPEGTWFTTQDVPEDDAVDSDADLGTGRVDIVTPADGQNSLETPDDPTIDAGLVQLNLSIVKTLLTTKTVHAGSTVKYELVPYNDGPSDALAGWTVTELLPSGLKLVAMEGLGYSCDVVTATCTSASPLPAGTAGGPITVTTKVKSGVKGRQWNVAYVSPSVDEIVETNPLDVVPTNDTDTDLTTTDNDDQAVVNVKAIVSPDDDGDGDDLAYTGSDAVGLLGIGALALVAGGGLLLMRRRRSVD